MQDERMTLRPRRDATSGTTRHDHRNEHPPATNNKTRDAPRDEKARRGTRSPGTSDDDEREITPRAVFPSSYENETRTDKRSTSRVSEATPTVRRTIAAPDEKRGHTGDETANENDENETATTARSNHPRPPHKSSSPPAPPTPGGGGTSPRPADRGEHAGGGRGKSLNGLSDDRNWYE